MGDRKQDLSIGMLLVVVLLLSVYWPPARRATTGASCAWFEMAK